MRWVRPIRGVCVKSLVIIPTYNERENIEAVIGDIGDLGLDLEILIVDDNSPDGTGELAECLSQRDPGIHVLHRPKKMGLGCAYIEGFKFALEGDYEFIFEMDADFSHDPKTLPRFLEEIQECDLVLGSRYINGITVVNWPMNRLLLSYAGNWYARTITRMPIRDTTGGFKCFRRRVLESIDLDQVSSEGYSFQIEMTYRAWRKSFRIREIPIIFRDRQRGKSKMSWKINREAVWTVWRLNVLNWFGKI